MAFLSYGFRPFFLLAALWSAAVMALWILMLSGAVSLPIAFDPVAWHGHEFLFGYVTAVIAGFMLTAVPNWTGRPPITGGTLAALVALWAMGRVAMAVSEALSPLVVAIADLSCLAALVALMTRDIAAGKNWRNLIVVALLGLFFIANALSHWEAATGRLSASGPGMRLGLAAMVMLIAVIGGRVVPAFTRNWLSKQNAGSLPPGPMQRFDKLALLALLVTLLIWVAAPGSLPATLGLLISGGLHAVRLARWRGMHTAAEPLVLVLHAAYLFVPLGALGLAAAGIWPDLIPATAAKHLWLGGAGGLMTLAIMTRATLGHTGSALHAGVGTQMIYLAVILSVLLRVAAGPFDAYAEMLLAVSGLCWIAGFAGFALLYGPRMLRASPSS